MNNQINDEAHTLLETSKDDVNEEKLMLAIEQGDVNYLIENDIDVNINDGELLIEACHHNQINIVKYLIKKEVNVDVQEGMALYYASRNGYFEIVRILLGNKANPNLNNYASIRFAKNDGILTLLYNKGGNFKATLEFLEKQDSDIADEIIENLSRFLNDKLMLMIENRCKLKYIKKCLDNGADPNFRDSYSLFFTTLREGYYHTIKLLIEYGANINNRNGEFLINAAFIEDANLVKLLLKKGADIKLPNQFSLLFSTNDKIRKILVDANADLNAAIKHSTELSETLPYITFLNFKNNYHIV